MYLFSKTSTRLAWLLAVATLIAGCGAGSGNGSTDAQFTAGCAPATLTWELGLGTPEDVCRANIGVGKPQDTQVVRDSDISGNQFTGKAQFQCIDSGWQFIADYLELSCAQNLYGKSVISFTAATGGRLYDYFSDTYAEIGSQWQGDPQLDGFFTPIVPPGQTSGVIGSGVRVHLQGGNWLDFAEIFFDDRTYEGVGYFEAPIVDLVANLTEYVDGNQTLADSDYDTSFPDNDLLGIVKLQDNQVIGIELTARVELSFNYLGSIVTTSGSLTIVQDNNFVLQIGPSASPADPLAELVAGNFDQLYHWDYSGSLVLPAPVTLPE